MFRSTCKFHYRAALLDTRSRISYKDVDTILLDHKFKLNSHTSISKAHTCS